MSWNWTIITIIVCTMVICSSLSSHFSSLRNALADELDKIKERFDQLKRQNQDLHDRLERVAAELVKTPEQRAAEARVDAEIREMIAKANAQR